MSLYGKNELPADERPTVQVTAVTWPLEDPPVGQQTGSIPAGEPPDRPGRRRLLLVGGIVTALLVTLGGTAVYAYTGEVPRGIQVLGAELGGRSQAEATEALRAELDRQSATLTRPVPVRVGDQTVQVDPAQVGLTVDVPATVAAAAAARPDPLRRLFGSHPVEPVITVDTAKLDAVLRAAVGRQGRQMTMPAIRFTGTTPKPVYPEPSRNVAPDQSAQAVRDGWLTGKPITVPLVEQHPATTREEVDRLIAELARPAVAAPVRVTTESGALTISTRTIAMSLTFTADKAGKLTPRVDARKLRAGLASHLAKIEVEPKDARVTITGGKPTVVPGTPGRQLDTTALSSDLLAVLPKTDGREIKATLKAAEPQTTPEEVAKLGIKERVSTFTTRFTGGLSSARSQNIVTIAKAVDGTVVKPGATFSLNGHTGERNYAKGYQDAPVILDGKLVPGVGGGTSQFTTTLFNATYYAGLEDVEHKPHSYWFSRYPAVIESTIFYPDLDFRFRNNTPHGVVIDTSYTASSVTVSIWSTRIWDSVKTEYSPRRAITKPQTINLPPGPTCIATNGIDGFTQDAWRVFRKDGKEVRREKFSWTYDAEPRYICAKPPA